MKGGVLSVADATAVEALEADIEAVGVVLAGTGLGSGQARSGMVLKGRCPSQWSRNTACSPRDRPTVRASGARCLLTRVSQTRTGRSSPFPPNNASLRESTCGHAILNYFARKERLTRMVES